MSYTIKQISIFAENKPGRLAAIAEALEEERINIYAFSIAEASGFGVIRALVSDPARAHKKLTDLGYAVSFTDIIGIKMRDEPGGLKEIARIMGGGEHQHRVRIRLLWQEGSGTAHPGRVRSEDAITSLQTHGGRLLG